MCMKEEKTLTTVTFVKGPFLGSRLLESTSLLCMRVKKNMIKFVKLPWLLSMTVKTPNLRKIFPKKSDDKFFKKYCNQIKNEKGLRSHSYKLKTK